MKKFWTVNILKVIGIVLIVILQISVFKGLSDKTDIEMKEISYKGIVIKKMSYVDVHNPKFMVALKFDNGSNQAIMVTPKEYMLYDLGKTVYLHQPKCIYLGDCRDYNTLSLVKVACGFGIFLGLLGLLGMCLLISDDYKQLTNKRGFY